jgi:hypothetical protein
MQQKYNSGSDRGWNFWFLLPIYPYNQRQTIRREIVKDTIWCFEQVQGILYAVVTIRMTIIKLNSGGLLVYAPIAPTKECLNLVQELEGKYGQVKYIIHPTSSGLEHKIFVPSFARNFPQAQIFVAPNQWSFPFNLSLSWLGFPSERTFILSENNRLSAPFADEFDYHVLSFKLSKGYFSEVAFYHWRSQTLLLTDTIVSVPEKPPEVLELEPYPLLFHARDNGLEKIEDNEVNRIKGWQRICLFALYFRPNSVEPLNIISLIKQAFKAPDKSKKAYFGLFPFLWKPEWKESFEMLRANGRPFVAPILQNLILPQDPPQVIKWVEKVKQWKFKQIIPCHFQAPISTNTEQFREAFTFLEKTPKTIINKWFTEGDLKFIQDLENQLIKLKITTPRKEKV